MRVKTIADAEPYDAPKHFGMSALRLHGFDAAEGSRIRVGLSHFLPGGGAEWSAGPVEKIYVVLQGQVTVTTEAGDTVLGPLDSCCISANEGRSIVNRSKLPASMLVIIPNG